MPDLTNPHFAALVQAAGRAAREAELQLLLVDTGEHADEEVRAARTLTHEVDGFVVLSPRRLHKELAVLGSTPAVFVNRPVKGHASIIMRTAPAVEEAVRHLASLGHTDLAYVGGPKASWAATERRDAIRRSSAGHRPDRARGGRRAADLRGRRRRRGRRRGHAGRPRSWRSTPRWLSGVIAGLSRRGIAVPDEISVVGGDDVPMAPMTAPPLTAISLPTEEAGTAAIERLGGDERPPGAGGHLRRTGVDRAGQSLRSSRQRRRRWWAAAFGRRSRVNTPFLLPSTRMKDVPVWKSAKFQTCSPTTASIRSKTRW